MEPALNNKQKTSSLLLIFLTSISAAFGVIVCVAQLFQPWTFSAKTIICTLTIVAVFVLIFLAMRSSQGIESFYNMKSTTVRSVSSVIGFCSFLGLAFLLGLIHELHLHNTVVATLQVYFDRLYSHIIWASIILWFSLIYSIYVYLITFFDGAPKFMIFKYGHGLFFLFFVLFALISTVMFLHQPGLIVGGDGDDYIFMVRQPLFSEEFLAGRRPFTTALIYKVINIDSIDFPVPEMGFIVDNSRVGFRVRLIQTVIHSISWLLLSYSLEKLYSRNLIRLLILIAIGLIAFSPPVYYWNYVVMSESIAISLTVVLVGLMILIAQKFQWHQFYLIILVQIFWLNVRESNNLLSLFLIPCFIGLGLITKNRMKYFIISLLVIIFAFITSQISETRNRWAIPLVNVVYQRVLPDNHLLEFFTDKGMPLTSAVMEKKYSWACSPECPYSNPALSRFWEWIRLDGKRVYIQSMIAFPLKFITEPILYFREITGRIAFNKISLLESHFWNLFLFKDWGIFLLVFSLIIGVLLLLRKQKSDGSGLFVLAFLSFWIYPISYISYHGDAMEVARHSLQASVLLRVVFWSILFFLIDQNMKSNSN